MKVSYRDLCVKDIGKCMEIFTNVYAKQTLSEYPDLIKRFKEEYSDKEKIASICEALEYGVMSGKVAIVDGVIVGFVLVENPNRIRRLAVAEQYQNNEIGCNLIKLIKGKNSELFVHAAKKAIPFYEKCGFMKDGELNEDKYPYLPMKKVFVGGLY